VRRGAAASVDHREDRTSLVLLAVAIVFAVVLLMAVVYLIYHFVL
jgi:hypothetical protein